MRTEGSSRDKTWPLIRAAGIKLLYKHGFHGMNLRQLAANSGLQAGSLYNYFKNKGEFLSILVCDIMRELLVALHDGLDGLEDPEERLERFVQVMVVWHTKRNSEAMISQSEIRSLTKGQYIELIKMRKEFETVLNQIIEDGVKKGCFHVSDVNLVTVMILNMLVGISSWYKPRGRLSVDTLVLEYTDAITRILVNEKSSTD